MARDVTGTRRLEPMLDGLLDRSIYSYSSACYYEIVYIQGGNLLNQVRRRMGSTAFWRTLREYVAAHRYGIVTTPTLLKTLDDATPVDLSPMFRPRFPRLLLRPSLDAARTRRSAASACGICRNRPAGAGSRPASRRRSQRRDDALAWTPREAVRPRGRPAAAGRSTATASSRRRPAGRPSSRASTPGSGGCRIVSREVARGVADLDRAVRRQLLGDVGIERRPGPAGAAASGHPERPGDRLGLLVEARRPVA